MIDFKDNKGFAFLMVLLVIVVVGILLGAFINSSIFNIKFTSHQANKSKAYYAAEAGINHIKALKKKTDIHAVVNNPPEDVISQDNTIINYKTVSEISSNTITFKSTGTVKDNNDNIKAQVTLQQEFTKGTGGKSFIAVAEDDSAYFIDENTDWENFDNDPILESGSFKGDIYGAAWDTNEEILILNGEQNGGNNNIFMKNLDGEWVEEHFNGGGINHIYDINYNQENGKFYTINHNGKIHEAYFNGTDWITIATGEKANNFKNNANSTIGDNKFVFLESDSNQIFTYDIDSNSLNSVSFGNSNGNSNNNNLNLKDITYGKKDGEELFIAVGEKNDEAVIYKSSDGLDWNSVNISNISGLNSITWTGEKFMAIGESDQVITYDFDEGWNQNSTGIDSNDFTNIAGIEDFIITSSPDSSDNESGSILVSKDGGDNWSYHEGTASNQIPKFKNIISLNNGGNSNWDQSYWGFSKN